MSELKTKPLSPEEIRDLSRLSAARSWFNIFWDWGIVIGLFCGAKFYPHPVVYFVCFLGLVRQQHAFLINLHEATHQRVFSNPWLNRNVVQWLFGSPMAMSLDSYRRIHLIHHKAPLAPGDPDLPLTGGYPVSPQSLRRKLWRDVTGRSYFKTLRYFNVFPDSPAKYRAWFSYAVANGLLLVGLIFLGNGWLYLLWLLSWFTLLPVLLRIRGIAEHAGYSPNEDQILCTRTVLPSWQTWILSPHHVHYHVEHHLYPSVPHYRLPQLHRRLMDKGALPATQFSSGYHDVLSKLTN